jgi:hypothetical protein
MSLLGEYKASLKNITIEEYVDLIFFRPLAFLFVKSIYRTDITPNQITLISMLTGIFSGVMFAIGGSTSMIVGGLLLALATIFDCADGQLARLKNNGTAFGRILDGVSDYIYTVAAFVGIAIGGRNESMNPLLWWLFVALAGASYAVQAGLLDYYRNEFLANLKGSDRFVECELSSAKAEQEKYAIIKGHYLERLMLEVYIKYSSYQNRLKPTTSGVPDSNPVGYIKNNSLLIHLWALNGTSTHVFVLVCCAFLGRLDLFVWYILGFGSLYTLFVYVLQRLLGETNRVRDKR